jgi:hypothetical protein
MPRKAIMIPSLVVRTSASGMVPSFPAEFKGRDGIFRRQGAGAPVTLDDNGRMGWTVCRGGVVRLGADGEQAQQDANEAVKHSWGARTVDEFWGLIARKMILFHTMHLAGVIFCRRPAAVLLNGRICFSREEERHSRCARHPRTIGKLRL